MLGLSRPLLSTEEESGDFWRHWKISYIWNLVKNVIIVTWQIHHFTLFIINGSYITYGVKPPDNDTYRFQGFMSLLGDCTVYSNPPHPNSLLFRAFFGKMFSFVFLSLNPIVRGWKWRRDCRFEFSELYWSHPWTSSINNFFDTSNCFKNMEVHRGYQTHGVIIKSRRV